MNQSGWISILLKSMTWLRKMWLESIRKMFNSVHLSVLEQHTHRCLWKDLEDRPSDVWCIGRVNMGDKLAGTASIEAKDRTAALFRHINPQAADLIIESSYVDDFIDSIWSLEVVKKVTHDADLIISKGGFRVKAGSLVVMAKNEVHQVLGMSYAASDEWIVFHVALNFSPKRRKLHSQPNLDRTKTPQWSQISWQDTWFFNRSWGSLTRSGSLHTLWWLRRFIFGKPGSWSWVGMNPYPGNYVWNGENSLPRCSALKITSSVDTWK